ncbi:hypothetical protein Tco_0939521 [Tanacetum coccineum]|uniref:Uncharacterized protein n=1 Tax=Tanacetum coccineum TaxID=301880 RepID=A0ABQ5DKA0_9ASTR
MEQPQRGSILLGPTQWTLHSLKLCLKNKAKENPNTAKLRTKPIHHYNELMELFRKDKATCEASETAKERKNRIKQDEQPVETIDDIDQLLETNEISLENFTAGQKTRYDL